MRARFVLAVGMVVVLLGLVANVSVQGPPPVAGSGEPELFDLRRVSEGVYAAIAKPVYKINCNAVVIVLDDGVLVVDTHSKPSAARSLMNQIKSVTTKPVKYVVDTHFHWDHAQGNSAYPTVWPQGVEIISSDATRESIEQRGIPRVKYELLALPKEIATLKGQLAGATDAARRTALQDNLRQAESYFAELGAMQIHAAVAHVRPQPGDSRQGAHRPDSLAWQGPHGWRRVRVFAAGQVRGDRRRAARLDAVHGRQLSR